MSGFYNLVHHVLRVGSYPHRRFYLLPGRGRDLLTVDVYLFFAHFFTNTRLPVVTCATYPAFVAASPTSCSRPRSSSTHHTRGLHPSLSACKNRSQLTPSASILITSKPPN